MKKKVLTSLFAAFMFVCSGSAFADNAVQLWKCQLNDGKTADELLAVSKAWLDAAKTMDGGADLEVYVEFPEATNDATGSINWVLIAPDMATWGLFTNGYQDSAAAEADAAFFEVAECNTSSLWTSVQVE